MGLCGLHRRLQTHTVELKMTLREPDVRALWCCLYGMPFASWHQRILENARLVDPVQSGCRINERGKALLGALPFQSERDVDDDGDL